MVLEGLSALFTGGTAENAADVGDGLSTDRNSAMTRAAPV